MSADEVVAMLEGVKAIGQGQWVAKCPAHDDHTPSLSISKAADGKVLLFCHAGCRCGEILDSIGLHARDLFATDGPARPGRRNARRVRRVYIQPRERKDFAPLAEEFRAAITVEQIAELAESLCVSSESLTRLCVGYACRKALAAHGTKCRGQFAWSFGMRDSKGTVLGIRLRNGRDGFNFSIKGGSAGLFIPERLTGKGPLLLPEGPTDSAAALSLGFDAIGRPSCSGGVREVLAYVRRHSRNGIVVVADADEPGQAGARALAKRLRLDCPLVKVITPPAKDLRAWKIAGATRGDVQAIINATAPLDLNTGLRANKDALAV